ncbi:spore coat protein [Peribacillus sp. SCS-155]|uniref:spore coat protein n=1 Tax=Peribacillus sedimenti TaxID=3115297 RepID=UPI0039061071
MPFGAHETMEVHEILLQKVNMISHFNFYATEAKNPQLLDMIVRHQQEEIRTYNDMVSYTHDYKGFTPVPPNTVIRSIKPQDIKYGLNNPPQFRPEADAVLSDAEVAAAVLLCHKNGARNGIWAALECADPNLRQMLINSAVNCVNQAYEVFVFMNQQGLYQVPTLQDHTAKTFIHSYQPAGRDLENQYFGQDVQNAGYGSMNPGFAARNTGTTGGQTGGGAGYMGNASGADFNVSAPNSMLYGGAGESGRQGYTGTTGQSGNFGAPGVAGYNQTRRNQNNDGFRPI